MRVTMIIATIGAVPMFVQVHVAIYQAMPIINTTCMSMCVSMLINKPMFLDVHVKVANCIAMPTMLPCRLPSLDMPTSDALPVFEQHEVLANSVCAMPGLPNPIKGCWSFDDGSCEPVLRRWGGCNGEAHIVPNSCACRKPHDTICT